MTPTERWIGCVVINNNSHNIYTAKDSILSRSLRSDEHHIWAMKEEIGDVENTELPYIGLLSRLPDLELKDLKPDSLVKLLKGLDFDDFMLQRSGEIWRILCKKYQNPLEFLEKDYRELWEKTNPENKMLPVLPAMGAGPFTMNKETIRRLKNFNRTGSNFNREVPDIIDLIGVSVDERTLEETLLKYDMLSNDTFSASTLRYRVGDSRSDDVWQHMDLFYEGDILSGFARTCFIPRDFNVKGERYGGIEIKGYKPTSENRILIIFPDEPDFRVGGGLQLIDAVRSFESGMRARKYGKTDPLPIGFIPLFARCNERGQILEGSMGNKREPYHELGIYVRGRKTNLQLSHLEDVVDEFKRYTGLTDEEYFELFIRNMVRDYTSLVDAGFSVACLHSGNVSIIGNIKDEDEWRQYSKQTELASNARLAANIGYLFEHAKRVGMITKIEHSEDYIYKTIFTSIGQRVKSKSDVYFALKDRLVRWYYLPTPAKDVLNLLSTKRQLR